MRVLCIVHTDVKVETNIFIRLKKQGIDIHVISCKPVEPYQTWLKSANIPIHIIPLKGRYDRKGYLKIRQLLESETFDIIHAFNNKTVSNALLACRNIPVKFIAYRGIVGNVSFLNPNSWMTYLNPRVNRIMCVADAIRKHFLDMRFLNMRIPAFKPVTIHKGHEISWYQQAPRPLTEFGIKPGDFVVGCTANYRPRKGIEFLINALSHIPEEYNIHLLLVGHMNSSSLQKLIQNSPHKDRIHLAGFQQNAPEIIAACDACILASTKREGLPKTIIEGMAYGVPPIVTNSGGSPELIEPYVSGLLIPPRSTRAIANAILTLYHKPELRKQIGQAARERIRSHFNMENTVDKIIALYQELTIHDRLNPINLSKVDQDIDARDNTHTAKTIEKR